MSRDGKVPNLVVIGDVPVQNRVGGELLLYRLLSNYPTDRLRMIHGALSPPQPELQLPGHDYTYINYLPQRLFYNPLSKYTSLVVYPSLPIIRRKIERALDGFQPEAILAVGQDWLWLAALQFAKRQSIHSVLMCYDDWQSCGAFPGIRRRVFRQAYRLADARLCVCSSMAELYEREHGVRADVLWPNRGSNSPPPEVRVRDHSGSLTAIYAGSLYANNHTPLAALAEVLGRDGGEVHVYSPHPLGPLATVRNIRHCGFVPQEELASRAATTADLLFAPMSFDESHRRLSMTSFSSKLADYTAIGLPILVCGPEYSSAVRWVTEWPGVAALATAPTPEALTTAVLPLRDPTTRRQMAAYGLHVGNRMFGAVGAEATFLAVLTNQPAPDFTFSAEHARHL